MNINCPYLPVSYKISVVSLYVYVCIRGYPLNGWCPYLFLACAGFPSQGRVRLWECMCVLAEGWDDGTGTFDWWVIVQPDSARLNWWGHGLREEVLFVLFTFSCPSVWRLAILFLFIAPFYFFPSFFLSADHLLFPPSFTVFFVLLPGIQPVGFWKKKHELFSVVACWLRPFIRSVLFQETFSTKCSHRNHFCYGLDLNLWSAIKPCLYFAAVIFYSSELGTDHTERLLDALLAALPGAEQSLASRLVFLWFTPD